MANNNDKTKVVKPLKTQTVQEFLARGGKISLIPAGEDTKKADLVPKTGGGPAIILSMDECSLYYSDSKAGKVAMKSVSTIDFDALPEALKQKYLLQLKASFEDESEEDFDDEDYE